MGCLINCVVEVLIGDCRGRTEDGITCRDEYESCQDLITQAREVKNVKNCYLSATRRLGGLAAAAARRAAAEWDRSRAGSGDRVLHRGDGEGVGGHCCHWRDTTRPERWVEPK